MGLKLVTLKQIQEALDEIRPTLQNHNGDIEFVKFENDIVYVSLKGTCQRCPFSLLTMKFTIEDAVKKRCSAVKSVEVVESV